MMQAEMKLEFNKLNGRLDTLDGRMDKLDGRMDTLDGRMDKLDGRMDTLDGRMDRLEVRMDTLDGHMGKLDGRVSHLETMEDTIHTIMLQHEQLNSKLDAILEFVADVPDTKSRVANLETTIENEQAQTRLNTFHLSELRQDFDRHIRRPHPAK